MHVVKESSVLGRRTAGSAPREDEALPPTKKRPARQPVNIIDIRQHAVQVNLKEQVISMFKPTHGPPRLPMMLLYDEKGLQLFEQITYLDEYYLSNYEIELLKQSSAELASKIPAGSMVVELGSGNLRKICLLLQAFEDQSKPIDYYALDLSREELERTLAHVPAFSQVTCHGLLGTYDDGRAWLKQPWALERAKCIVNLGSSIGNFHRDDAADFLQDFAGLLDPERDFMILGLDSCCDPDKVYHAYNDHKGVTHAFILNGLIHANRLLGEDVFRVDDWTVMGEYVYDSDGGRHQAFLTPVKDTTVLGVVIRSHERIKIEQSVKYSSTGVEKLWKQAGLREVTTWRRGEEYGLHFLQRARLPFSRLPSLYAPAALPTLKDWEALWESWDTVTRGMLPRQQLGEKPIKLRNAYIFYLGHIPTFLDIQLTKTTGRPATEPARYAAIFERGIDPDVDSPEMCHAHSAVPDEWPPADEIADYQERVRARVRGLYDDGSGGETVVSGAGPELRLSCRVACAICVGFEHELMHLETLLYMMLQSDRTLPPPHAPRPDFALMADEAARARLPNQWFDVPAQTITVGMDDPEDAAEGAGHFGWDNEKPARSVAVHAFQAKGRPVTNEEYARYMFGAGIDTVPASWACVEPPAAETGAGTGAETGTQADAPRAAHPPPTTPDKTVTATDTTNSSTNGSTNGHGVNGRGHGRSPAPAAAPALPDAFLRSKAVRTVYGLVPLKLALDWPVAASYDDLARCAAWMGGRIPTADEARSIYSYVDAQKNEASTQSRLAKKVPAVNGHLVNDGVQETPPADARAPPPPPPLFVDLTGANVGFHHWHPEPVTARGDVLAGRAAMGGVWEWTSSPLVRHAGFTPMALYPAYTADFFDGKHNIVLGGSWATHPRIAGRTSFVNWYQRNYPYAWAGARLVRDVPSSSSPQCS